MQITDKDLMELIRKNIKLTIPYAGAFLKRDDRYDNVKAISVSISFHQFA